VNPLVDFAFDNQTVTFANAAVDAGVATAATGYQISWSRFDNRTGAAVPLSRTTTTRLAAEAPAAVTSDTTLDWLQIDIAASHPEHPSWATPVTLHFRRVSGGWQLAGVRRLPD
jgi:hypothetical protein